MSHNFFSLDLELNKEGNQTTAIVQIGGVIGNIETGEIIEKLSLFVNSKSILDPFIIKLTGITQEIHDSGMSLMEAYNVVQSICIKHEAKTIITWGGGDVETLKKQLNMEYPEWPFSRRFYDTKTLYQAYRIANDLSPQAGLKKACSNMKVAFEGPAHRADMDAYNTFKLFIKMLNLLKGKD